MIWSDLCLWLKITFATSFPALVPSRVALLLAGGVLSKGKVQGEHLSSWHFVLACTSGLGLLGSSLGVWGLHT